MLLCCQHLYDGQEFILSLPAVVASQRATLGPQPGTRAAFPGILAPTGDSRCSCWATSSTTALSPRV